MRGETATAHDVAALAARALVEDENALLEVGWRDRRIAELERALYRAMARLRRDTNRSASVEDEWHPISTLPQSGQALVTDDDPDECLDGRYGTIELINCPMLTDGRTLNQNSGNYTRAGVWKWWRPAPAVRFAAK